MLLVLGLIIVLPLLSNAPLWPQTVGLVSTATLNGTGWWEHLLFINNLNLNYQHHVSN